jgi:thermitase
VSVANATAVPAPAPAPGPSGSTADTIKPTIKINNPVAGNVSGTVAISITATDNSDVAGIRQQLLINGVLRAYGNGGTLAYNWQAYKATAGKHTIKATAKDKAGNLTETTLIVTVVK